MLMPGSLQPPAKATCPAAPGWTVTWPDAGRTATSTLVHAATARPRLRAGTNDCAVTAEDLKENHDRK